MVGEKLSMSWQCELAAQKVKRCPGLHQKHVASRVREGILFLHSALVRPSLEGYIQVWGPQYK